MSGGTDIRGLSGRVPSLNIESSFGRTFPRFYIRGLGNTDFDLNASQPVSLVYDDVVLENPILKGFPAFDVDRDIEMARSGKAGNGDPLAVSAAPEIAEPLEQALEKVDGECTEYRVSAVSASLPDQPSPNRAAVSPDNPRCLRYRMATCEAVSSRTTRKRFATSSASRPSTSTRRRTTRGPSR